MKIPRTISLLLIELLKMSDERQAASQVVGLVLRARFAEGPASGKITRYLKCGRRPADALAPRGGNFPSGVIELWKRRLGRAN